MIEALLGLIPTSLKNTVWTDAKAGYLDVPVSSAVPKAPASIVTAAPGVVSSHQNCAGLNIDSPAMGTAGAYYTLLNIASGAGWFHFGALMRAISGTVGTPTLKMTVDGVAALTGWTFTPVSQWDGAPFIGATASGQPCLALPIRFNTSLKIELTSTQASLAAAAWKARVMYTLE